MQLFAENSYIFEAATKVISIAVDEKGTYLVLDRTVFYPQGGGQPSDVGTIKCRDIVLDLTSVRKDGEIIKHYIGGKYTEILTGEDCLCALDGVARTLHMRYHSAGHLLSNVAESICNGIVATKAHCFPNEAYVEFTGTGTCERDAATDAMKMAIEANLPIAIFETNCEDFEKRFYKLPYPMPPKEILRTVQIGNYKPIPCGGTHLASTIEIGNFEVTKIKNKNGNLRISFAVV
ncbi:MAG: alanyl-tRNA editing protein [Puniceicoccales bacterium]|jgi:alanyl-tRNA synthetase|nr:alanyl-tRNA editing protein [Puniceicoccales bacterium]